MHTNITENVITSKYYNKFCIFTHQVEHILYVFLVQKVKREKKLNKKKKKLIR